MMRLPQLSSRMAAGERPLREKAVQTHAKTTIKKLGKWEPKSKVLNKEAKGFVLKS